jgi:hypothetical protein
MAKRSLSRSRAINSKARPGDYLACEDIAPAPLATFFSAGVPAAEMPEFMKRGFDDAPKTVHDPAGRIKDQDRDSVAAEVIYTSMGMPLFGLADAEFRAAGFRAFNDWATDYCGYDLERLIPLGLVTLEDIPAAIAELERIKRKGMVGAMIWREAPADRPAYADAQTSDSTEPHDPSKRPCLSFFWCGPGVPEVS